VACCLWFGHCGRWSCLMTSPPKLPSAKGSLEAAVLAPALRPGDAGGLMVSRSDALLQGGNCVKFASTGGP